MNAISKVRKLLHLAGNHAATEGEIQAAMLQAQRLMEKYHLSEEDLAHEPDEDYAAVDQAPYADYRSFCGRRFAHWEKRLASFVADFIGCRHYIDDELNPVRVHGILQLDEHDRPRSAKSVVFYGVADDAALATHTFGELRLAIATMARIEFGQVHRGDGATYCLGFVHGLELQAQAAQERARIGASSTALTLRHRTAALIAYKQERSEQWLARERGISLRTVTSRTRVTGSDVAWERGITDGRATDVSRARQRKLT